MTYIPEQKHSKSSFGDSMYTPFKPHVSFSGVYGARNNTEQFTATGGTITTNAGDFLLKTGTSVGGYAVLWSRKPLVYIPGNGSECRITGRFSSPVALSLQTVGMFSSINGMFAGYNGIDFGFMHRHSGGIEIQELNLSTPSNVSATATITLNGTDYTASVTNATAEVNAEEIASGLRAGAAGLSWHIQAAGARVVFQFKGAGAKSGSYTLAVSSGNLAGTFTQDHAGLAPTETWTNQADWSEDTCSWLDPSKGNIYKFEYAYLGYGPLKYSVFNPETRDFTLAHVVDWTNDQLYPNFNNPSMRPGWVSASLGSTTDLTVAGASALGAIQGETPKLRPFGHSASQSGVSTETAVTSLQVRHHFQSRAVGGIVEMKELSLSTDSTKGAIFRVYRNATLGGTAQWNYEDEDESIVLYDDASTTVSGATPLATYTVGPNGSYIVDLKDLGIDLVAGDTFTITGERISGSTTELSASIVWGELI